jgi:hypothetical protein
LAISAAFFIRVSADGAVLEFARCRIAARVVSAARCAAAIALLTRLDNAVSALLAGDEGHVLVVAKAKCFDAVAADS